MRALLAGLVPNLPAETVEAILTRAEGVPLYAVETVRMAADRGALVPEGGIYAIAGSFGELAVPETLQALIASRLDGLSPPERSLLGDAAVLGTTFTLASLSAVNGTDPARLEPLLRELVRREILTVDADPRSPERGQYGFVQGLIREVAYGTLARSARRAKHLAAAHHFESLADEELAGVVAAHYSEAHRASPAGPEAEAVAARARDWLAQAGERATSLGSPEQALSFFEQALELTDSDLERAELSQRAGAMACRMGRVDDGLSLLERSAALFADGGLGHRAARVESLIAEVEFLQGHLERAIERMERAVTRMAGDEPDADLAAATGQLGRFLALAGRHQAAISRLEDALTLAEALQLPEVLSHGLNSRSLALDKLGRSEESTLLLEHALRIALEHDLGSAAVRAYNNLIVLLRDADRYQAAIDLLAPALALAERIGDRLFQVGFTTKSLVCHAMLGQWDEALARGAAAQELMSGLPTVWWGAMEIVELAPLHAHRGDFDQAHAILESVRDETIDAPEYAASAGTAEAEVLLAEGRPREALAAAERALAVRSELGTTLLAMKRGISAAIEAAIALGDVERATEILGVIKGLRPGELTPYLRAQAARLDARILATLGREEEAERGFEAAAGAFGEIHAPFLRAVTQLEHAEWLIQRAGGAEVRAGALLGPARDTFERLRATPWIERASRVGAGATIG